MSAPAAPDPAAPAAPAPRADPLAPDPATPVPAPTPSPLAPTPDPLAPDPAPPPPTSPAWTNGMAEADVGYVENKGWKEFGDAIKSYKALETTMGAGPDRLVVMPKEDADSSQWEALYTRLGRPNGPELYDFGESTQPTETAHDLTPQLRAWAHTHGLTQKQAAGLYGDFNGHMNDLQQSLDVDRATQTDKDIADLQREWGGEYQANLTTGKKFLQRFEISDEQRTAMEDALGTKGFIELAARIGRGLGEHAAPGDGGADSGAELTYGMTPAGAKARISALQFDNEFMKKYAAGSPVEMARMQKLHELAYPDAGA